MTYLHVVLLFFQWFYWGSLGPWLALAHELGHNFNFDHDNSKLNILRLMNIYSKLRFVPTINGALLIAKLDISPYIIICACAKVVAVLEPLKGALVTKVFKKVERVTFESWNHSLQRT